MSEFVSMDPKRTHNRALRYATINSRPIATFAHDLNVLTSVFQVANT